MLGWPYSASSAYGKNLRKRSGARKLQIFDKSDFSKHVSMYSISQHAKTLVRK